MSISPARRAAVIDALRRGTVPAEGLDQLAVGLDHLESVIGSELDRVASGGAVFKAVRGEYGSGKTFAARWIEQHALARGFAVSEVQISELETPLHKLETVYRRLIEELRTDSFPRQAFRSVLDLWLFQVETDAETSGQDPETVMEERLAPIAQAAPVFPLALRGYRRAVLEDNAAVADGLAAWLGGQPTVSASIKSYAGVKSDLDHFTATGFIRGLLEILRGSGHPGLVLVLDEVETLQRMRSDTREKALNALRQWIDEIDSGNYPGLYLLITGTTAFFEGPQGIKRLPPLESRLHVDFSGDPRWDNPRLPQIRLQSFNLERLGMVGRKVRDLYVDGTSDRVAGSADDTFVDDLASSVAGELGGQVGIAPRQFLRTLIDVLDRVDIHPDFDPRKDYTVDITSASMNDTERAAIATDPDDIEF
ncbi:BREX system ATP-binding protein BrxD [Corynebacterium sp. J010B-136]|uniref:BREX system ATP-binding protein BrxD n=1 Tax=Corynebacterium sp. J010B-136 TaxID=2099401 RepID=UPI000CF845B5|nr:BREX system ATP-binding protein BrxD [Corynebacterium sp. J010B-136]PQM73910.1 BREX system ATP-binding protein BrxD [Corynebacterium sp. J010B-136]